MGWKNARGWRPRRRFKENPGGRTHSDDAIELTALAASAFVVLVVAVAGAGVFAAVTRQLASPLEAAAYSGLDAPDAAREAAPPHDHAGGRSR